MNESAALVYDTARALFLLWVLHAVARPGGRAWPSRVVIVSAVVAYVLCAIVTYQMPYDFKRFWQVGRDLAAGVDYYALDPTGQRQLILNPPTVLPLFRVWAVIPLRASAIAWTLLNAVGVFGLVPLAYRTLRRQETRMPLLPRPVLGLLATALALSCANGMGLALGQVSMLAVAAIVLALWAQAAQRPWLAGLALAVATIKVNTMLPFLTLFLRRRDVPTWLGLGAASLGLCLLSGPIADLPRRCATTVRTIRDTFEPGHVNDYSDMGDSHASLVGFDQALYRLGLRDRRVIAAVQLAGLSLLLAGLARHARRPNARPAESCALAALVAGFFFYHRVYDELILVLPIIYGALRAQEHGTSRASRLWYAVLALALLVPFVSPDGLRLIHAQTASLGTAGFIVRGVMLPLGVWLIGLALALAWRASSLRTNESSSVAMGALRLETQTRPRPHTVRTASVSLSRPPPRNP